MAQAYAALHPMCHRIICDSVMGIRRMIKDIPDRGATVCAACLVLATVSCRFEESWHILRQHQPQGTACCVPLRHTRACRIVVGFDLNSMHAQNPLCQVHCWQRARRPAKQIQACSRCSTTACITGISPVTLLRVHPCSTFAVTLIQTQPGRLYYIRHHAGSSCDSLQTFRAT